MTPVSHVLSLTSKLVSFPTFNNNFRAYEDCFDFIDSYLEKVPGLKIKKYSKNGFPSRLYFFNNEKSAVTLNGHVDVVPGKKNQFKPKKKGARLIGRGTYDMKTACASFVHIFKEGYRLMSEKNVSLMMVSDEEIDGKNGTEHILKSGFSTKFCLCGEPTELQMVKEAKGSLHIEISIPGKSSHSARPWLGINPVYELENGLRKLVKKYPQPKKETFTTTLSATSIQTHTNSATSIPSCIKINVNIRINPKESKQEHLELIKKLFPHAKIELISYAPAIVTDPQNNQVLKFRKLLKKNNLPITFRKAPGTADLRFFTERKVPGIGFGLKGGGAHSDYEWVDIDSINIYYKILKEFIFKI